MTGPALSGFILGALIGVGGGFWFGYALHWPAMRAAAFLKARRK